MIQAISEKITKYMVEQGIYNDSYEIHKYGIEVIISTTINLILIMIIGIISDRFIESMLFCFGFWFIRKFSGGYHCETYFKCITTHILTFVVFLLTSSIFKNIILMISVDIFAVLVFMILSPIKNRKCSEKDYKKYKVISILILFFYITLSWFTSYSDVFTYVILSVSLYMIACLHKKV